jgi:hypothetical protein
MNSILASELRGLLSTVRYNEKTVPLLHNFCFLAESRRCTLNYPGVDFHKYYSLLHLIHQQCILIKKHKVPNRLADFEPFSGDLRDKNIIAVTEACRNWPVIIDFLSAYVQEIKLAHPLKAKAIASAKIKTDSIDAEFLAYLLRADG